MSEGVELSAEQVAIVNDIMDRLDTFVTAAGKDEDLSADARIGLRVRTMLRREQGIPLALDLLARDVRYGFDRMKATSMTPRSETFFEACGRHANAWRAQARIAREKHGADCELAVGYEECARQLDYYRELHEGES